MRILDTMILREKVRKGEEIRDFITIVNVVEYPSILRYKKFKGEVIFPEEIDYELALRLQVKLEKIGKMKGFSDLLIAAIAINRDLTLITRDKYFLDIKKVWKSFNLEFIED